MCFQVHVLGRSLKIHHQADSCGSWQVPSSLLSVSWSHPFQPCEPLHRATHTMETCFPQRQGSERDGSHHLSGSWFLQWHPITFSMLYLLEVNQQVQSALETRELHKDVKARRWEMPGDYFRGCRPHPLVRDEPWNQTGLDFVQHLMLISYVIWSSFLAFLSCSFLMY